MWLQRHILLQHVFTFTIHKFFLNRLCNAFHFRSTFIYSTCSYVILLNVSYIWDIFACCGLSYTLIIIKWWGCKINSRRLYLCEAIILSSYTVLQSHLFQQCFVYMYMIITVWVMIHDKSHRLARPMASKLFDYNLCNNDHIIDFKQYVSICQKLCNIIILVA